MIKKSKRAAPEEWMAGLAMLGVMGVGFWQAVVSLGSPGVQEIPLTLNDFRQGRTTGTLSTQLDKNLPLRGELISWANAGRYLLTHGAGDQVRVGRDGWLFSVEELQFYDNALNNQKARLSILTKTSTALKEQGVTLIVALVPDKARVYAKWLSGGRYPDWNANRYQFSLDALRQQGVDVVNLLPVLTPVQEDTFLYYRTDTHWSQLGAKRAAEAVVERIKSLGVDMPQASFETTAVGPLEQKPGDLLRMMNLSDMPNWTRPRPDFENTEFTKKAASNQPVGLFDAVSVPVVLVGTSYSLRSNFHGYLEQALGADVLNVARDGGGFIQSAKDYLANESFKTAKPQIIVWELPERMLSAPLSESEKQGVSL